MSFKVQVEERDTLVRTYQVRCSLCGVVDTVKDYHTAQDNRLHHELSHHVSGGLLLTGPEDSDQNASGDKPVDG